MRWTVREPVNEHISENNDRPPAGKWKHIQTRSSNNNAPCNQWPNGFVQKVCCGLFCYRMEMHIVWKHGQHEEAYRSAPMRFEYRASCPEDTVKQVKFICCVFFSRNACATLVHLIIDQVVGWLVHWSFSWLILTEGSIDLLIHWSEECLIAWFVGWLNDWFTD